MPFSPKSPSSYKENFENLIKLPCHTTLVSNPRRQASWQVNWCLLWPIIGARDKNRGIFPHCGTFNGNLTRIYASLDESQRKFRTVWVTSTTSVHTQHLPSTNFQKRTSQPLVQRTSAKGHQFVSSMLNIRISKP